MNGNGLSPCPPPTSSKTLLTSGWWEKQQDLHPERQLSPCPQIPGQVKAIYQNYGWEDTSAQGRGQGDEIKGICLVSLQFPGVPPPACAAHTSPSRDLSRDALQQRDFIALPIQ